VLTGLGSMAGLASFGTLHAQSAAASPLRFALTPVLLTSDLIMLEELKVYLFSPSRRQMRYTRFTLTHQPWSWSRRR
jgi:hypothetical protein